jgi:hypothetical protein
VRLGIANAVRKEDRDVGVFKTRCVDKTASREGALNVGRVLLELEIVGARAFVARQQNVGLPCDRIRPRQGVSTYSELLGGGATGGEHAEHNKEVEHCSVHGTLLQWVSSFA